MIHLTKQLLLQYCFILTLSITTYSSEQTVVSDYIRKTKQQLDMLYTDLSQNKLNASEREKTELSLLTIHPVSGLPVTKKDIVRARLYVLPDYLEYLLAKSENAYVFSAYVFSEGYAFDIIKHIAYFNRNLKVYDQQACNAQSHQDDLAMRARYIKLAHILTKYQFTWNELFDKYRYSTTTDEFGMMTMQEAAKLIYADHDALRAMNLYRPGAVRLPSGKVPEQSLWDRTKQAWNNVKAEIPKIIDRMPQ